MSSTVIDFLMKSKNSDGSFSVLHPYTKSNNVKTSTDISVMLTSNVGSYKNGDTIPANTSIDTIVRKLLQVQIPPTYTAPAVSLTAIEGTPGSYEVGTSLDVNLTASYTANDAGNLSNLVIYKNNTAVSDVSTSLSTHSESITLSSTVTYKATATYLEGAVKNDNFNEPYSTGHIAAGSKDSNSVTYSVYRKYFYGADSGSAAATTSANVRAFAHSSTSGASSGTTFNISVTAGQTRATFAYPASLRDVSSVKYVEFNNDESKNFFTKTTVSVDGASANTGTNYKVYTYIPDQPFPSNMTFKVTI